MVIVYTIAYLTTDSILKNNVAELMTVINSYFSIVQSKCNMTDDNP